MQWIELSVRADSNTVDKIARVLEQHGQGGAAIEERQPEFSEEKALVVKIYVPHSRSYRTIRKEIEHQLDRISDSGPVHLEECLLKSDEWFDPMKKYFGIVEIGEKIIIKPSWTQYPLPASGKIIIELDPGAAFGTGLHSTTRLCLFGLERYLNAGMTILDLGTGSGILSIAAAKLGASAVTALDIDPVAVRSAKSNTMTNCADDIVRVKKGTLSSRFQREYQEAFDIVLANITARTISDLSQGFPMVLKPGGKLITSGIHPQGLDEVLINLSLAGLTIESIRQEGEWYLVVAARYYKTLIPKL